MTKKILYGIIATALTFHWALPATAQSLTKSEMKYVRSVLTEAQRLSFDNNREYCGYFGYIDGEFQVSDMKRGRKSSCRANNPPDDMELVASFHTHGRYNPNYDSEIPSSNDIIADSDEGVDGFMATPGGRLWFIDGDKETTKIICDLSCLPQDSGFEEYPEERPAKSYTLEQILDQENG